MPGGDDAGRAQVAWLVRELRAHMRKAPKRFALSDLALHAFALYETNVARLPADHLACRAGCGSCCAAHVGVEAPEAFAIVRHLRDTLDGAALEALLVRIAETAARVSVMDPGTRWEAQVPCVFLDVAAQSCTIYPVRPLACRGYTSTDLAACEASSRNLDHAQPIPADAERQVRALQVRQAVAEACARLVGRDGPLDHVELHGAVSAAAALDDELAWVRANRV